MDGTLQYNITLDNAAAVAALSRFNQVSTAARAAMSAFAGSALATGAAVGGVVASIGVLLPLMAAVSVAVSGLSALAKGIGLANEAERTSIAFRTLTGDAKQAAAVVSMLSDMAIETPFDESTLQGAARSLLAARVPAGQLKAELTAIGNIAASISDKENAASTLRSLATVYAQVAGKGKLYAEELQQFVEQGAGELRQAVAATLGVTTGQLMEMMSAGEVGFSTLQQAIQSLAGETGQWGNAMQAQSVTNLGLLSSLGDNVSKILRMLAAPISDGPLKTFLQTAVNVTTAVAQGMSAAISQGEIGTALFMALSLGAKQGFNAFMDFLVQMQLELAKWAAMAAAMISNVMRGNISAVTEMAAQIGSFDMSKMRFNTGREESYFDRLIAKAKETTATLDQGSKTWAKGLDATEPAGSGGGSGKKGKSRAEAEMEAYNQEISRRASGEGAWDDLISGLKAKQAPASDPFMKPEYRLPKGPAASSIGGATSALEASRKIQGYSAKVQGGATEARERAAARMQGSRTRLAGAYDRGFESFGEVQTRLNASFGAAFGGRNPGNAGAAVQAALPGAASPASSPAATAAGGGNAAIITKLDAVVAELQRIRTE